MRGATALLMTTLFLSNILGFLRDRFLAQRVAAADADIYFNAFRLPDLVFNVLILGAITTAFIPIFTEYLFKKEQDETAWRFANTVVNLAAILLLVFLVILFFMMPILIPLVSPFSDGQRVQETINLSRLLLLQPFLFGLSYIAGALLNSFKRFVAYAVAPLIYNLSIIFGILYFSPTFGVSGVVYGVLLGALLHFMIQVPTLLLLGYRYRPIIDLKLPALRKMVGLMLPRAAQLILLQFILLAYARFSAQLDVGSVSSLNYADNIQTVPTVIFGNAFALASFPYLSEAFSKKEDGQFARYLLRASKAALFLLIPSAVGLYLLRAQIVRLILGSGHFGWEQTVMTAQTLGMYAIGLVALGLLPLYSRAFFARQNTKTPMLVAIPSTLVAIILGWILAFNTKLEVSGLALAFSLSTILQLVILYFILRRNMTAQIERELWRSIGLYLLLALVMGGVVQMSKTYVGTLTDLRYGVNVLLQGGLGIVSGGVVYLGLALIFRLEEVEWLWKRKKIFTTN